MHPLHVELTARLLAEDRLAHAAAQRRVRASLAPRPSLRARIGAGLVRTGTRLQTSGTGSPRPVAGC